MPETITWLHISDTHFHKEFNHENEEIFEKFFDDLEKMKTRYNLYPDLIFFTGDVVHGQFGPGLSFKEQYEEANEFLRRVRSIFPKVPISNIFIVPGNHDVNRAHIAESQTGLLKDFQVNDKKNGSRKVNEIIQSNNPEWKRFMERLNDYKQFLEEIGYTHLLEDSDRLTYSTTRDINGFKVGITGLNSAWSCCGSDDKGSLWLGTCQISKSYSKLKDTMLSIVISHHPPNWFTEFEDLSLDRELEQKFDFYLHGHEHQDWVKNINKHVRIPAGALYSGLDNNHKYNFVRLYPEENRGHVFLRRYNYGWVPNVIGDMTNDEGIWSLENLSINPKKKGCIITKKPNNIVNTHMKDLSLETVNVQLLRNNAHSFKIAAERCLEQRPLPGGKIESPLIPAVTNLVFSIELYLKFLLAKENKQPSVHRLFGLFNLLDLTIQNNIIKATKYSREEFELLLNEHSEVAIEWKYIHIYGKNKSLYINIEFLREVVNSLEFISNRS